MGSEGSESYHESIPSVLKSKRERVRERANCADTARIYATVFRMVFNFCTRANTEEYAPPPRTGNRRGGGIAAGGGAEFIGSDLYERLKEFLSQFAKVLLEVAAVIFVKESNPLTLSGVPRTERRGAAEALHDGVAEVSVQLDGGQRHLRLPQSALDQARVGRGQAGHLRSLQCTVPLPKLKIAEGRMWLSP